MPRFSIFNQRALGLWLQQSFQSGHSAGSTHRTKIWPRGFPSRARFHRVGAKTGDRTYSSDCSDARPKEKFASFVSPIFFASSPFDPRHLISPTPTWFVPSLTNDAWHIQSGSARLLGRRRLQNLVSVLSFRPTTRADHASRLDVNHSDSSTSSAHVNPSTNVLAPVAAAISIMLAVAWKTLRPYFVFAWMCFFRPIGNKEGDQQTRLDSVCILRYSPCLPYSHGCYSSWPHLRTTVIKYQY